MGSLLDERACHGIWIARRVPSSASRWIGRSALRRLNPRDPSALGRSFYPVDPTDPVDPTALNTDIQRPITVERVL